ncbi:MAG: hypothetical protein WKG06_19655 [Segetibacter sp.]
MITQSPFFQNYKRDFFNDTELNADENSDLYLTWLAAEISRQTFQEVAKLKNQIKSLEDKINLLEKKQ